MPYNWVQVIETDVTTHNTDICMEGEYQMTAKNPSGYTNIAHHAHHSSAWHKNPINVPPDLFQFRQKSFVILYVPHLARALVVTF